MADIGRFRIRRFDVRGGGKSLSVTTPIACNYFSWKNRGQFVIKVDTLPYDATSYGELEPGALEYVVVPPSGPPELHPRYRADEELFRLSLLDDADPSHSSICEVQFIF